MTDGWASLRPMLATRGDRVPTGADWRHEVKWDGVRALVDVSDGAVRVRSRTGRDLGVAFPELEELGSVVGDALIDGEVVRLGEGVPTLGELMERVHVSSAARSRQLARSRPVTLLAFDVLRAAGRDLLREPWSARREVLEALGLDDVSWQVPASYDDGPALLAAATDQGLEGIVSKRVAARYEPGARSRSWLKFPIRPTGSFAVGGWRHETDSPSRIGALHLGQPTPAGLAYRGRVGSGVAGRAGRVLTEVLAPLVRATSPFLDVPRVDAAGSVWVEPEVVVDVEYLMITADGRLRQPVYRGVRTDVTPADLLADL